MATLKDLQNIPNAPQPTAGQGLTLDLNGLLPPSVFAPSPADQYVLRWNATTKKPEWALVTNTSSAFTWTTYTPTWSGSGTPPAIGNGTITGRYCQLGKYVTAAAKILAGSSTTFGTGNWTVSLPVASGGSNPTATVAALDSSAASVYFCWARNDPLLILTAASPAAVFSSTVPFAWTTSDTLEVYVTYEAA